MPSNTHCRVLIVDDNRTAADILATLVRLLGHEVVVAYGGESGIRIAQAFYPDLVLLDLVMPGTDGFSVARQLRRLSVPTKIVALTAFNQPAFIEAAGAAGFDCLIAKPATADQLTRLLLH